MRLLGFVLVPALFAGCDPARGDWVGTCAWTGGGGAVHEQDLRLDLDGTDSAGMGTGSGRAVEDGDPRRGDVLFELLEPTFALDLYLPKGDLVLLRGEIGENGRATGRCGSPKVEEFQFDALFDCVLEIDPSCDTQRRWEPDGVELAPVERRELDGDFVLHRE